MSTTYFDRYRNPLNIGDNILYAPGKSGRIQRGKVVDVRTNKYTNIKVLGHDNSKAGWTYDNECVKLYQNNSINFNDPIEDGDENEDDNA
jgi:hypothetical protein